MASIPVAAATTAALRRHFGPLQPAGDLPTHIALRTVDRRGEQPTERLWVNTRFGRGSRLLAYIEEELLSRLGFEWVAVRPAPEVSAQQLESDVLRLLDRTPVAHNYLSLLVVDESTHRPRLDDRSPMTPVHAITPYRVQRVKAR